MKRLLFMFRYYFFILLIIPFILQDLQAQEIINREDKEVNDRVEESTGGDNIKLESLESFETIFELITYGSEEELREACRERGLSDEGSEIDLKRRLLHYDHSLRTRSFHQQVQDAKGEVIILHHAEVVSYGREQTGEELILLEGGVDLTYGTKRVKADRVKLNLNARFITGSGKVTFIDGKRTYYADRFFYNIESDEGLFFNGKTTLSRFVYTGKTIRKVPKSEKYIAQDVKVTTCDIENPHYKAEAETLYFYDNQRVLIKNMGLWYGMDEVLKIPYFYRNLQKPALKTAVFFRERSGLVVQNSYYPVQEEQRELILKGDFYERLGIYTGAEYKSIYESGKTEVNLSAALSKDIYYYDSVTENWSPLGPLGGPYSVDWSVRGKTHLNQKLLYGKKVPSEAILDFTWISDPYYDYDFERRSQRFDVFKIIEQAEYDYPRKGSGYTWVLANTNRYHGLKVSVTNRVRFEPQRDSEIIIPTLPEYYQYRIYTLTAPSLSLGYSQTLMSDSASSLLRNISMSTGLGYGHIIYYDSEGEYSSELHRGNTFINLKNKYKIIPLVKVSPEVEIGATGQHHVRPSATELSDDRLNTMLYGKTEQNLLLGSDNLNLSVTYKLKYKLSGPDDYYLYGRFREHSLGLSSFGRWKFITAQLATSVDLRPEYDWEKSSYEDFTLSKERFNPLIGELTIQPAPVFYVKDRLVYDFTDSRFKTNSFILNYRSNSLNLDEREIRFEWNFTWEHNFINPVLDTLRSTFSAQAQVHPYLFLYFSVHSRNDDIWRYFPDTAEQKGVEVVNPLIDLAKSVNFFNPEHRKESNFKMKSISLGLIHDLHEWELKFDYTGNRELNAERSRYLWNNTYSVSIGLKEVEDVDIHTTFSERR